MREGRIQSRPSHYLPPWGNANKPNQRRHTMSIDDLKNQIPEYAKDIKLNLSSLSNDLFGMSEQQFWGCMLASALATRNQELIAAVHAEAKEKLSEEALRAAKGAASIMAMNNVYYRFLHLLENEEFKNLPAKLRMNIMMNPGVDKEDFELWSTSVSAVNGCGMCIKGHVNELLKRNVSKEAVQHAARIGSVLQAVAATLDGEKAMGN